MSSSDTETQMVRFEKKLAKQREREAQIVAHIDDMTPSAWDSFDDFSDYFGDDLSADSLDNALSSV